MRPGRARRWLTSAIVASLLSPVTALGAESEARGDTETEEAGEAEADEGAETPAEPSRFYGRLGLGVGLLVMNSPADAVTGVRPALQGAVGTHVFDELALALRSEFAMVPALSGPLVRGGSTSTVTFSTEVLADWYPAGGFHAEASLGYQASFSGFLESELPIGPTSALGAGYDFLDLGDFTAGALAEIRGVALPRGDYPSRLGLSPMLLLTLTDRSGMGAR